jgi:DNA replication and repair protein RecF
LWIRSPTARKASMQIERLTLKNFRNYTETVFSPGQGLNILIGLNAQGKSNLLEAITLLATTRSYRAGKDLELIRWGETHAALSVQVARQKTNAVAIEVFLATTEKKVARVNQVRYHKIADLLGHLNAVIFSVEDINIVRGEPSDRRRFLNVEISQASPSYCHHLLVYKKCVEQRNRLLKDIQAQRGPMGTLQSWNSQLTEHGARLTLKRWEFVKLIDVAAREIHKKLTDGLEELQVLYRPSTPLPEEVSMESIRLSHQQALEKCVQEEILRGVTLIGPHRDDLMFNIEGADARIYASQGQQRTAALSVKLAEVQLLSEIAGEPPVVLLDDVMSELDDNRRAQILQFLADDCQAFITCTNLEGVSPEMTKRASIFTVRNGEVQCADTTTSLH